MKTKKYGIFIGKKETKNDTKKEDVLEMFFAGMKKDKIANELGISEEEVKDIIRGI